MLRLLAALLFFVKRLGQPSIAEIFDIHYSLFLLMFSIFNNKELQYLQNQNTNSIAFVKKTLLEGIVTLP